MTKDKLEYRQYVAFINREDELKDLRTFIDKEPSEILFIHGPKSSGKTTLLYKFFEQIPKEQKLDVKFLDLRETFTSGYEDFIKTFFQVETPGEKKEKLATNINVGFFKIDASVEKKILEKRADPFKVMKAEFLNLTMKGIKPVLIIDELQALDKVYLNNGRDRQLIIELFNFFVAMTKQSHLAHIIISSSDGYFINRVFIDSRLKKTSTFYKVDYLNKEDVMEWLLNLEKYSKIKDYTLTRDEAEKIWELVGGSMWEIQDILSNLFRHPLDEIIASYKEKMRSLIVDYVVQPEREKIEKLLRLFQHSDELLKEKVTSNDEILLRDMVRQNILYFDPTKAKYYPQGKSYHHGIKLYFQND
ncbi:MAG: ATP-binding protein [Candidatus Aminicenantes bacterium]|jgi:AAA+ ATPase superfamily predicted ATPase